MKITGVRIGEVHIPLVTPFKTALRSVDEVNDIVIALTHIGYGDDKHLARETRNVDLIVGGHSHTFLKKPYLGTNLDGWTVPVVQNGCWGLNVGNLKISVDR